MTTKASLRVREAALVLGVDVHALKRWAEAGAVPHGRTPGGQMRFDPMTLEQFRKRMTGID